MNLIDSTTPRHEVFGHLGACPSCAALLGFARDRGDLEALACWREQLAAHVEGDRERRHFHEYVVARIAAA